MRFPSRLRDQTFTTLPKPVSWFWSTAHIDTGILGGQVGFPKTRAKARAFCTIMGPRGGGGREPKLALKPFMSLWALPFPPPPALPSPPFPSPSLPSPPRPGCVDSPGCCRRMLQVGASLLHVARGRAAHATGGPGSRETCRADGSKDTTPSKTIEPLTSFYLTAGQSQG